MGGRWPILLAVLCCGCLGASVPQGEASVVSSTKGDEADTPTTPEPVVAALPPEGVQEQVQAQQQVLVEQVQQVGEMAKVAAEVRWRLIEKRYEKLDKEARARMWAQKPPAEGSPEAERYREWLYIAENQSKLRGHPKPPEAPVAAVLAKAEVKAEEAEEEAEEAEEEAEEAAPPPPPPPALVHEPPSRVEMKAVKKKAWKPRWKK